MEEQNKGADNQPATEEAAPAAETPAEPAKEEAPAAPAPEAAPATTEAPAEETPSLPAKSVTEEAKEVEHATLYPASLTDQGYYPFGGAR